MCALPRDGLTYQFLFGTCTVVSMMTLLSNSTTSIPQITCSGVYSQLMPRRIHSLRVIPLCVVTCRHPHKVTSGAGNTYFHIVSVLACDSENSS